jgi:hypothetical protein
MDLYIDNSLYDRLRTALEAYDDARREAPSPLPSIETMAKEFIDTIADRENFTDDEWQSFMNKICAFAARVAAEQWEKFREAVDVAEWLSRKWGDPNGTVEQQAVWDHSMNRILPRLRAAIRQSASEG